MPTEHFRSRNAMRKNLAWRHLHNVAVTAKRICVRGKGCHKVEHSRDPKRRRIDAAQRRKIKRRTYVRHNRVFHRRHERG